MLIQSFLHSSIDSALSFASDLGKEDFLCDWMAGAETWQMFPKCDEDAQDRWKKAALMKQEKKIIDGSSTFSTIPQLSTVSTMSEISAPNLVYRRRKLRNNSITMLAAQASGNTMATGCCISASSSEAPSAAAMEEPLVSSIENMTEIVGAPDISPVMCNIDPLTLKSELINLFSVGKGHGSGDAPKNGSHRTTELSSENDSCSSSKSNSELGSASRKHELDDIGECSSSVALIEAMGEDLSEKDFCISILRSQGLLDGVWHVRTPSSQGAKVGNDNSCSRSCKVCDHSENTLCMLICDNCEEAYHTACSNPRVKKITLDEWFCHSCLKRKHKLLKEATSKSSSMSIKSEPDSSCRNSTSKGELRPIAFMLKDTEPYTTGVRIGRAFQAEVPDWTGPLTNDVINREPLEMDPSESIRLHEWKCKKDSRVSSIGNWLQCHDVIDGVNLGVDGTICGKWRRAPLFEVQTDDWDCFRSLLWDPTHSDCAVPQELETDQVLKQLKYIEMLRPRLTAKRQKLDSTESTCLEDPKQNTRNIQTSRCSGNQIDSPV